MLEAISLFCRLCPDLGADQSISSWSLLLSVHINQSHFSCWPHVLLSLLPSSIFIMIPLLSRNGAHGWDIFRLLFFVLLEFSSWRHGIFMSPIQMWASQFEFVCSLALASGHFSMEQCLPQGGAIVMGAVLLKTCFDMVWYCVGIALYGLVLPWCCIV